MTCTKSLKLAATDGSYPAVNIWAHTWKFSRKKSPQDAPSEHRLKMQSTVYFTGIFIQKAFLLINN